MQNNRSFVLRLAVITAMTLLTITGNTLADQSWDIQEGEEQIVMTLHTSTGGPTGMTGQVTFDTTLHGIVNIDYSMTSEHISASFELSGSSEQPLLFSSTLDIPTADPIILLWDFGTYGTIEYAVINGVLEPQVSNITDCQGIESSSLYIALHYLEQAVFDFEHDYVLNGSGALDEPFSLAVAVFQLGFSATHLIEDCEAFFPYPNSALCGEYSYLESCYSCCKTLDNTATLASFGMTKLIGMIVDLVATIIGPLAPSCFEDWCMEKPHAPGEGGHCEYLGVNGTCHQTCTPPAEPIRGVCHAGLECCAVVPPELP